MKSIRTDVAIAGAGPAGLATALGLARAGLSVALLQREPRSVHPSNAWDPRVFALSPASRRFLTSLGAWAELDMPRIAPVYDMRIYPSALPDAREVHLSAYEAGCEGLAWIAENSNIVTALEQTLQASKVKRVTGQVVGFDADSVKGRVRLELADGPPVEARLVVGADGAGSAVRALAGIAVRDQPYGQRGVVAHLAIERPHRDTAAQWFGEHGILAMLPLPSLPTSPDRDVTGDIPVTGADTPSAIHRCSMVWSTHNAHADELLALDGPGLAARLREVTGDRFGTIDPVTPPLAFDLHLMRAERFAGDRLALVGDAAHVVHPLAGQGLNLGFGDVSALVQVLSDAKSQYRKANFDPGAGLLLRRYQRRRLAPVANMQIITDWLSSAFDAHAPLPMGLPRAPWDVLRDMGWNIVSGNRFIRQQFIRYATQDF